MKQIFRLSSVKAKAKYVPQRTKGMGFLQVSYKFCTVWRLGKELDGCAQAGGAMRHDDYAPGGRDPGLGQPWAVASEPGHLSKSSNLSESQALYFQKRDQPSSLSIVRSGEKCG